MASGTRFGTKKGVRVRVRVRVSVSLSVVVSRLRPARAIPEANETEAQATMDSLPQIGVNRPPFSTRNYLYVVLLL